MLEIIALIFLCKKIGNTAKQKGLKPGLWKLITVVTWLGFEMAGAILGIFLFGFNKNNLWGLMAFAIICAFGGYLLVKAGLDKRPDQFNEDDINNLGRN